MAVFINPQGDLREFPPGVTADIHEEAVMIFERCPVAEDQDGWRTRPGIMLWRRVEPWEVAELRARRKETDADPHSR